jgi:hypothetical protein
MAHIVRYRKTFTAIYAENKPSNLRTPGLTASCSLVQARFDERQTRAQERGLAVRSYVPAFLKITARDIEQWADGNPNARATLPVLHRKLVHSTGQGLSRVDFPGYDNAEKRGWDGRVDAAAATPWIPLGSSGWEFGCNADPKKKADGDYEARVADIPPAERAGIDFVFGVFVKSCG